jgi:hypothetical protein
MSRRVLLAAVLVAVTSLITATAYAQPPQPAKPADLSVTVTYKGKGLVDASKDILVFLFDRPDVTANSRPISHKSITRNGGTVSFEALSADTPVYVFVLYDKDGNYSGTEGPPPAGVPIAMYSATAKGPATAVKPGAKVKMTLDDSRLWK